MVGALLAVVVVDTGVCVVGVVGAVVGVDVVGVDVGDADIVGVPVVVVDTVDVDALPGAWSAVDTPGLLHAASHNTATTHDTRSKLNRLHCTGRSHSCCYRVRQCRFPVAALRISTPPKGGSLYAPENTLAS
jgi:hypothetical protein